MGGTLLIAVVAAAFIVFATHEENGSTNARGLRWFGVLLLIFLADQFYGNYALSYGLAMFVGIASGCIVDRRSIKR
jgi:ABC-type siderophore export system fused ATPase/permease subunit